MPVQPTTTTTTTPSSVTVSRISSAQPLEAEKRTWVIGLTQKKERWGLLNSRIINRKSVDIVAVHKVMRIELGNMKTVPCG